MILAYLAYGTGKEVRLFIQPYNHE